MTTSDPHAATTLPADGPGFRRFVAGLPDDACRDGVLAACLPPIIYSRHHWLRYKGEYRVRADLRGFLEELQATPAQDWDDEGADLLYSLYVLALANVGLEELRDRVDSGAMPRDAGGALRPVRRRRADRRHPGCAARQPRRARRAIAAMRPAVEPDHHLYSIIDGQAWYRAEGLIPRADVDEDVLTETVERVVAEDFGVEPGRPAAERLYEATRRCIAEYGDSAPLLRAIMAATLEDEVLRADHVTLTCPLGDLLDTPEAMTTSQAFFVETQLREGIDLGEYAERLGHESDEQLARTIKARMLKLKRGAIRSQYAPGCLQGRFVEKHGGHMLYLKEDAHYRGHQSVGVHSGGRASFGLRYSRDGEDRALSPMVGDYRVVRMSHATEDIFTVQDLARTIRYGEWLRAVVEETYRAGVVLRREDPAEQAVSGPVAVG